MRPALKRLATKIDPSCSGPHYFAHGQMCGATKGFLPAITIAWCIGSLAGLTYSCITPVEWLLIAGFIALLAGFSHCIDLPGKQGFLLACFVCVGSAHAATVRSTTNSRHAALAPYADGRIVELQGTVSSASCHMNIRRGRLEQFGYAPAPVVFHVSNASVTWAGAPSFEQLHSIRIIIRDESIAKVSYPIGSHVSLRGRLRRKQPPTNPNTNTFFVSDPWIEVPSVQLISIAKPRPPNSALTLTDIAMSWRLVVRSCLDAALEKSPSPQAQELVRAIVLGIRTDEFNELSEPYRRTGLAHYLAVSGFAFGVLIAIPSLLLISASPVVRSLLVTIVVVLGLTAVDLRAPALRAGIVACAIALGSALARDWNQKSLLSLAALILLILNPSEVLNAGFQLSFSVVAGLILLAPVLARRLPFAPRSNDGRIAGLFINWLRTAIACGIVAWGTATPIVLYHFGLLSPIGVILSVLAAPVVAFIVAAAIAAIAVGLVSPTLALIPGTAACLFAQILDVVAGAATQLPGAYFVLPSPHILWVVAAEVLLWRWVVHIQKNERRILALGTTLLVVVLLTPSTHKTAPESVELITLDVGNGTCHILTSSSGSVLVDSGSSNSQSCAHRIITPALRTHGVAFLDAVIITHANLDHFSCVGDLIGRIPIGAILVGQSFTRSALQNPNSAAAECLNIAKEWDVPVKTLAAGDQKQLIGLHWTVLHPENESSWEKENNASLVLRVDHPFSPQDMPAEVLFTGDIEEEAIRVLLNTQKQMLQARVLEIPHHGSISESTERFVHAVNPELIVQSTGIRRMVRDKLKPLLNGRKRIATALAGAIQVHQSYNGPIHVTCFQDNASQPGLFVDPG